MALPTIITVSGLMLDIDGTPTKGHVAFYSPVPALSSGDETVVVPSHKLAVFDETGAFEIELPASDDPAWTPEGWKYKVVVNYNGSKYAFETVIPYDANDGLINFSELLPAEEGGSELYAPYNHTHAGGGGDVTWSDITGKPSTFPPSTHSHAQSDVTGLVTALNGKASTSHSHAISDVTDLQTSLDGKSATGHGHAISDVTNLQSSLDGKAATSHSHVVSDTTGLQAALDGKAATSHTHTIANTTGLQAALDAKADDSEITALDARVDALEAAPGGGTSVVFTRGAITSGNITPADHSAGWGVESGSSFSVPAAVGDNIEVNVGCLLNAGAGGDYFDLAVVSGSTIIRTASSDTSTPSLEGDPVLYPDPDVLFRGSNTFMSFEATSGDIVAGNITFAMIHKGSGGGQIRIYASSSYPFRWSVRNYS